MACISLRQATAEYQELGGRLPVCARKCTKVPACMPTFASCRSGGHNSEER